MKYLVFNTILLFAVANSCSAMANVKRASSTTRKKRTRGTKIPNTGYLKRSVLIYGLNRTEKNQVDIKNILIPMFRDIMKIKFDPDQIIFTRRLGKLNDTVLRPVWVTFNNTHLVERVLFKRKKLRGMGIKILMHLPRALRDRMSLMRSLKPHLRSVGEICKAQFGNMYVDRRRLSKLKVEHYLSKFTLIDKYTKKPKVKAKMTLPAFVQNQRVMNF